MCTKRGGAIATPPGQLCCRALLVDCVGELTAPIDQVVSFGVVQTAQALEDLMHAYLKFKGSRSRAQTCRSAGDNQQLAGPAARRGNLRLGTAARVKVALPDLKELMGTIRAGWLRQERQDSLRTFGVVPDPSSRNRPRTPLCYPSEGQGAPRRHQKDWAVSSQAAGRLLPSRPLRETSPP